MSYLLFLGLLVLESCDYSDNISGIYTGNGVNNIDTLIIFDSGEYKRRLYNRSDGLLLFSQEGTWKFTDRNRMYFKDYFVDPDQNYPDNYSFSSVLVGATFEVDKSGGSLRISYSPWETVKLYYTKIDT